MGSPSKEDNILRLILENSPLREWHFEELRTKAGMTKAVANKWIKKYVSEGLIKKVRKKNIFPYYTVGENNHAYYSLKRVYALQRIQKSGFLRELLSQPARTIIIFGSMIRGDWYKDSDIDIFVLGNLSDFNRKAYEERLNTHIEMHVFENKDDIKKVKTGLIKNVINGYIVKGQIQDIAEIL